MNTAKPEQRVTYNHAVGGIVIDQLTITDPAVVAEARHWADGCRGRAVSLAELESADLSSYATVSFTVGANAMSAAGGLQEAYDLEALIAEVGERTSAAAEQATKTTGDAVDRATKVVQANAEAARKAMKEAERLSRKAFKETVNDARTTMLAEVTRLVGGDHPELLTRLSPLLERFGQDLDRRSAEQTEQLITKVIRQFDPADPTSPMSQHTKALTEQQNRSAAALKESHDRLAQQVSELTQAVEVQKAARETAASITKITPLKGSSYEGTMHALLQQIAVGLGDDYVVTANTKGRFHKKGDGVLSIDGTDVRIVMEMHDSTGDRRNWSEYLYEAERNRGAIASLGLLRSTDQLKGDSFQVKGQRRVLMAFDPESDDPQLLRTVVQVLRTAARAASVRRDEAELETVREKLGEALGVLTRIDAIRKASGLIRTNANSIESEGDKLSAELTRLIGQAQTALAGVADPEGVVSDAA